MSQRMTEGNKGQGSSYAGKMVGGNARLILIVTI